MNSLGDEKLGQTVQDSGQNYTSSGEQKYRVYARRWFVLFILASSSAVNGLNYLCFAPVADLVATYLNTSSSNVNWFTLIFLITLLPPIGLIGADLLDRFGLRFGLIALAVLQALGSLVRSASLIENH